MVYFHNRVRQPKTSNPVPDGLDTPSTVLSDPLQTYSSPLGRIILEWALLLCLFFTLPSPSEAEVADPTWQVGGSVTHSSGDYGTGSTTTITYVPISIRRLFDSGDITLVIPYLSITGNC